MLSNTSMFFYVLALLVPICVILVHVTKILNLMIDIKKHFKINEYPNWKRYS